MRGGRKVAMHEQISVFAIEASQWRIYNDWHMTLCTLTQCIKNRDRVDLLFPSRELLLSERSYMPICRQKRRTLKLRTNPKMPK
jgi:hypothetical protein